MKIAKLKTYKQASEKYSNVLFFSEGKPYWSTFEPVITTLIKKGQPLSFVTMDPDDPGLKLESELVKTYYIGNGFNSMLFMNMLEATAVIMTTPGLGTLNIKRSPGVKNYIHMVHSPTDMAYYRKYSFEHFDTIMCSGEHQIKTLRVLEKIRNSKEKVLLRTGCLYMDNLAKQINTNSEETKGEEKTVLIAPSWGPNGALTKYGSKLVLPLLDAGYKVIIRPHPQQFRSEATLIKKLKKETSSYSNLEWDSRSSGHLSFICANIMISDLSGVIFDFSFAYNKPVISLEYDLDNSWYEASDLDVDAWELKIREKLGAVYKADGSKSITRVVKEILKIETQSDMLKTLRDNSLFNYGKAGDVAAEQIINIINN